ncbi:carbohydrate kinase [bacterium B17]|nr:carbohydrate kinase [bacterium B17]
MSKYLLGVDNGGTMAKAALFTTDGKEVAVASRKVNAIQPQSGYDERDMTEIWQTTADAIKEVVSSAGIDASEIAAVACAGHGNGVYLVDADGNPTYNAIYSTDGRAQSYIDQWMADGVNEKALPMTTQCLWAAQPNAILSWFRDEKPEVMEKTKWVLMCKDYIRFRMTGNIAAELTDMSGTSLMNVVTGEYDDKVLEVFGLSDMKDILPPLVKSADLCGEITAEAAEATGLKEGTPVAGGMFDIDACGLASGIMNEDQMSLVAGTWGNNQYIAKEPLIDKDLFMTSCYSMPGWYLMLEGSPTSASNLEWFITEFMAADKVKAKTEGKSVYKLADELAFSVSPEESIPTFLPFLYGSNAGAGMKSALVGMEGHHTRAHILRAIFEGVVFGHNTHLQRLLNFREPPAVIRFTGGAARSVEWVQMFADCFQIPIEIPAGTELGALGAAIAAGVACGTFASYEEAVGAMSSIARRQDPDPAMKDIYSEKYQRYHNIIEAISRIS